MNLQLANTEEYIDGSFTGNLGEVLIRYAARHQCSSSSTNINLPAGATTCSTCAVCQKKKQLQEGIDTHNFLLCFVLLVQ